jgi:hypothetical protein
VNNDPLLVDLRVVWLGVGEQTGYLLDPDAQVLRWSR